MMNKMMNKVLFENEQVRPPKHIDPLRFSSAWQSEFGDELKEKILGGLMLNDVSGMQASGIPPHVVTNYRVAQLMEVTKNLQAEVHSIEY